MKFLLILSGSHTTLYIRAKVLDVNQDREEDKSEGGREKEMDR